MQGLCNRMIASAGLRHNASPEPKEPQTGAAGSAGAVEM
jgi:hypothetical protein